MTIGVVLVTVGLLLALANGANDNFKGVATLLGSGTANYRQTLAWATVCTFVGSLTAMFLARELLKKFSGKGLVADTLVNNPDYASAVACGAGLTVLLATRIGMPISTTHGLLGALVGAGWAAGSAISFHKLNAGFVLPLLLSPLIASTAALIAYPFLRIVRQRSGITAETCLCVGNEVVEVIPLGGNMAAMERASELSIQVGSEVSCQTRYQGNLYGVNLAGMLDWLHFLTAGILSFARGLNDTPKIAALLLVSPLLSGHASVLLVGIVIAAGGILSGRFVAETMSHKITRMNHGQGFIANVVSGTIVVGASFLGMPVSTTHVSCGALFGIGAATGGGHWKTIGSIAAAWLMTLPCGALLGAISYVGIHRILAG